MTEKNLCRLNDKCPMPEMMKEIVLGCGENTVCGFYEPPSAE